MYFITEDAEAYYKLLETLNDNGVMIRRTSWGFRDNSLIPKSGIVFVTRNNAEAVAIRLINEIDEEGAIQVFRNNMVCWERIK